MQETIVFHKTLKILNHLSDSIKNSENHMYVKSFKDYNKNLDDLDFFEHLFKNEKTNKYLLIKSSVDLNVYLHHLLPHQKTTTGFI